MDDLINMSIKIMCLIFYGLIGALLIWHCYKLKKFNENYQRSEDPKIPLENSSENEIAGSRRESANANTLNTLPKKGNSYAKKTIHYPRGENE